MTGSEEDGVVYEEDVIEEILDSEDELIGYSCKQIIENRESSPEDVQNPGSSTHKNTAPFYFTLTYPEDHLVKVANYVNRKMFESIARTYHILSGEACVSAPPLIVDHTWLVSIESSISQVHWFPTCKIDATLFDPEAHLCHVARLEIDGITVGQAEFPDVITFVEAMLQGEELTADTPYDVSYIGGANMEDNFMMPEKSTDAPVDTALSDSTAIYDRGEAFDQNGNDLTSSMVKLFLILLSLAVVGLSVALQHQRKKQRRLAKMIWHMERDFTNSEGMIEFRDESQTNGSRQSMGIEASNRQLD